MHLRAALVLAFTVGLAALPTSPDSLESVLERMDRTAASFRTFSADLRSVAHTAVIDEDDVTSGTILVKRANRGMDMLMELTTPAADRKSIAIHGQRAEIYYPKMKTIEEYDISRYRALLGQFLLIGFGTSGKELAEAYNMKVLGTDQVAGLQATRLELVPKSPEVLKNLKRLELWIPESGDYPVQQKFYLAAGDYKLATYTERKKESTAFGFRSKAKSPERRKARIPPEIVIS